MNFEFGINRKIVLIKDAYFEVGNLVLVVVVEVKKLTHPSMYYVVTQFSTTFHLKSTACRALILL